MNNLKTLLTLCLASGGLLVCSSTAGAEDFPHRKNLDKSSRQQALGDAELHLLERQDGPGKAKVAKAILEKLDISDAAITTENVEKIDETAERVRAEGDGWTLQVYGDGTNVKYWNHQYLARIIHDPARQARILDTQYLDGSTCLDLSRAGEKQVA